jgi:hypothetical protein
MPAVSQAQRAYIYQKFGKAWAERHHFDNPGKLPEKVSRGTKPETPKPKPKGK